LLRGKVQLDEGAMNRAPAIKVFVSMAIFSENKIVKSCALLLVFVSSIFDIAADPDSRRQFLNLYYKGEYEKAHAQLNSSISDPVLRQIWESRLHLQENISGCSFVAGTNRSADAFAHLNIGQFAAATSRFTEDWISLWGKAIYAHWNADSVTARRNIEQALNLQPENPELLFFAGDVAESSEKTIEYFTHFLKLNSDDPVKRNIAEFSIELLKKTAGMELNIIRAEKGVQEPVRPSFLSAVTGHPRLSMRS
jgi:tetratricopeptide (TPR) repeat protein